MCRRASSAPWGAATWRCEAAVHVGRLHSGWSCAASVGIFSSSRAGTGWSTSSARSGTAKPHRGSKDWPGGSAVCAQPTRHWCVALSASVPRGSRSVRKSPGSGQQTPGGSASWLRSAKVGKRGGATAEINVRYRIRRAASDLWAPGWVICAAALRPSAVMSPYGAPSRRRSATVGMASERERVCTRVCACACTCS
jgi:hypothetical protein